MKKTKVITVMCFITLAIFSCKKKNNQTAVNNNSGNIEPPAVHVNTMTATVNGTSWSWAVNNGYEAYAIAKVFNKYYFSGQSNFSNPYTRIQLSFPYTTPGTYTLGGPGANFTAVYSTTASVNYISRTGTINIVSLDTLAPNNGVLSKFMANYSFVSDTVGGQTYTVTGGLVDYIKK